ncbi:MAG: DnaJ domain-containing protein [Alphaproteobacteria bacterium]|nr:DnaJ domain-containing protein [Alphaproteobacteria bacterium]
MKQTVDFDLLTIDLYQLLEVNKQASKVNIQEKYCYLLSKAVNSMPSRSEALDERKNQLTQALEILCDTKQKEEYDNWMEFRIQEWSTIGDFNHLSFDPYSVLHSKREDSIPTINDNYMNVFKTLTNDDTFSKEEKIKQLDDALKILGHGISKKKYDEYLNLKERNAKMLTTEDFKKLSYNYYEVLEATVTMSISDIKKSFNKLALKYHPDRSSNRSDSLSAQAAAEKMVQINNAWETINNQEKRKYYDEYLSNKKESQLAVEAVPSFHETNHASSVGPIHTHYPVNTPHSDGSSTQRTPGTPFNFNDTKPTFYTPKNENRFFMNSSTGNSSFHPEPQHRSPRSSNSHNADYQTPPYPTASDQQYFSSSATNYDQPYYQPTGQQQNASHNSATNYNPHHYQSTGNQQSFSHNSATYYNQYYYQPTGYQQNVSRNSATNYDQPYYQPTRQQQNASHNSATNSNQSYYQPTRQQQNVNHNSATNSNQPYFQPTGQQQNVSYSYPQHNQPKPEQQNVDYSDERTPNRNTNSNLKFHTHTVMPNGSVKNISLPSVNELLASAKERQPRHPYKRAEGQSYKRRSETPPSQHSSDRQL